MGCHFLLPGIFPTLGSNLGLPHCRQTLLPSEPPWKSHVLKTNAKSKKCNPVEAGLYKFKALKLDSGIPYSGHIFPKKLQEKPPTVPIGFDFEMENRTREKPRGYWKINTLFFYFYFF